MIYCTAPNTEEELTTHISDTSIKQGTLCRATKSCGYTSSDKTAASSDSHSKELFKLPLFRSQGNISTGNFKTSLLSTVLYTMESSVHIYNVVTTFSSLQKPVPPWTSHLTSKKQILPPFQVSGTSVVAPNSKEPVAHSTKTFVARSLAQFYNSPDTSRVSILNPEAPKSGLLLPEVRSWILLGQLLRILLTRSSLLTPTVKGDFNCSPDDGEPSFEGNKKVFKFSGSTVPVSPSASTTPNILALLSSSL